MMWAARAVVWPSRVLTFSSSVPARKALPSPAALSAASHRHCDLFNQAFCGSSLHALTISRGFYFPRRNWFPWRQRLVRNRQAALRKKRHIWPRNPDPDEEPIFGGKQDGQVVAFREKEIKLGMRRMLEYVRLIRGKQIQDAYDWVDSMARMQSESIKKMLKKIMQECLERHNMDLARVYVFDAQPQRGFTVKSLKMHARAKFGINKSPRHMFMIRVREMPLEESFHRLYIFNKVPRSLAGDMRLALHEGRVNDQQAKEWAPYLCANSRIRHRHELKWLDSTRQFDYYAARQEWIQRYKANLLRGATEAREARGLPPLVAD